MCGIFASQAPKTYACVTRSVRLCGHATSIRLESRFWDILEEIANKEGVTMPKFLNMLHGEALETHGDVINFASLLRVSCLVYLSNPTRHGEAIAQRRAAGAQLSPEAAAPRLLAPNHHVGKQARMKAAPAQ